MRDRGCRSRSSPGEPDRSGGLDATQRPPSAPKPPTSVSASRVPMRWGTDLLEDRPGVVPAGLRVLRSARYLHEVCQGHQGVGLTVPVGDVLSDG